MADDGFARVRVQGLRKLTGALRKAGVEVKDLKAANVRVARIVVNEAVPITPRATGALAGSVRPGQRQSGAVVYAGGGRIRYARFVEFGTKRMAARSYLYKGAQQSQPEWLTQYERELNALMSEVAARSDGTGD